MKLNVVKSTIYKQQHALAILLLLLFKCTNAIPQEMPVSGEASVLANDLLKTRAQYEYEALLMAREYAIEKAFGTSVISNYERLSIVEMQGRSVAFNSEKRSNYLNTFPNGVWTRDESRNCIEEKDKNGNHWFKCRVTGYARKIEAAPVKFIAYTLDGTNPSIDKSERFMNGESGYLYFRCPENGYLVVFYDDMKIVQRCIPYNAIKENYLKVESNREYILFSIENGDYIDDKKQVDEIEFYTEQPFDYNQFYILFSPAPLAGYFYNPPEPLEGGYSTFKSMDRDSFHSWLQDQRIRNKDLQIQIIGVTITK